MSFSTSAGTHSQVVGNPEQCPCHPFGLGRELPAELGVTAQGGERIEISASRNAISKDGCDGLVTNVTVKES